jgi:hypothetical protein
VIDTVLYVDGPDTLFGSVGRASFTDINIPDIMVNNLTIGFTWTKNPADPIEKVILQEFDVINTGVAAIPDLEVGFFADYDVATGGTGNTGGGDSLHNTVYQTDIDSGSVLTTLVPEVPGQLISAGVVAEQNTYFYPFVPGPYDSLFALMTAPNWVYPPSAPPTFDFGTLIGTPKVTLLPGDPVRYTFLKWFWDGNARDVDSTKMPLGARQTLYRLLEWKGYYRGDINYSYKLDVADVIYLVNYLFKGGPKPDPMLDQADVNNNGKVLVEDVIYMINYLFKGGPGPIDRDRFKPTVPSRPGLFVDPLWKTLGQ